MCNEVDHIKSKNQDNLDYDYKRRKNTSKVMPAPPPLSAASGPSDDIENVVNVKKEDEIRNVNVVERPVSAASSSLSSIENPKFKQVADEYEL